MSVALLSGDKNVEISDELEAFFYVLLYHAIRYLWSNLSDEAVATYLDEFFDQYSYDGESYRCGARKLDAIQTGKLMFSGNFELKFHNPLNHLIAMLLSWFQANHTVSRHSQQLEDEERQQKLAQAQMPPPPPPLDNAATRRVPDDFGPNIQLAEGEEGPACDASKFVLRTNEPTKQEREDAQRVQKHAYVFQLLDWSVRKAIWPENDKTGDRIPKTWVRAPLGSTALPATKSTTSNKKARTGRVDGFVTAPLPSRPPQTPRKNTKSRSDDWWAKKELEQARSKGHSLS